MKNKKVLITAATHGDEEFSIPVLEKLSKKFNFEWKISNPRALRQKVRFTEADLNRSGPGNLKSKIYEERRAKKLIVISKKFNTIIDLHGTVSNTGCFIILSDPNWQNIELAKSFDIKNVVLWPSLLPTGPLTQFIPNSLEIECGPKNDKKTAIELEKILTNFLSKKFRKINQNYFIVTGKFIRKTKSPMKDFVKFSYKGGSFYPLMIGQYSGIKCYMMQKLSDTL